MITSQRDNYSTGINNYMRRWKDGTIAVSARVVSVEGDMVKVKVDYDPVASKRDAEVTLDLSGIGGAQGVEKGQKITALGYKVPGKDAITAGVYDIGKCRVGYNGHGICAGDAKYSFGVTKSGNPRMTARVSTRDKNLDAYVTSYLSVVGSEKSFTKPEDIDKLKEFVSNSCAHEKLAPSENGYPFDAVLCFRYEGELPEAQAREGADGQPRIGFDGKQQYVYRYSKSFLDGLTPRENGGFANLAMLGAPDMAAIKAREKRQEQANEEFRDVKADAEVPFKDEAKQAPAAAAAKESEAKAEDRPLPFEMGYAGDIDYGDY